MTPEEKQAALERIKGMYHRLSPERQEKAAEVLEANGLGAGTHETLRAMSESGGFFEPVQPLPRGVNPGMPEERYAASVGDAEVESKGGRLALRRPSEEPTGAVTADVGEATQIERLPAGSVEDPGGLPDAWSPEGDFGTSQMLIGRGDPLAGLSTPTGRNPTASGNRIDWFEPTLAQYEREMGPLQPLAGEDGGKQLERNIDPEQHPEFRAWADQKYREALERAKAEGRPIRRIERLIENGEASWKDLGLFGLQQLGLGAQGVDRGMTGGMLSAAVVPEEERRFAADTTAGQLGYVGGMFHPAGLTRMAAAGLATKIAPQGFGLAANVGRLGAAGAVGAAEGALQAGLEHATGVSQEGVTLGEDIEGNALWGGAFGAGGELLGQAARAGRTALRRGVTPEGVVTPKAAQSQADPFAEGLQAMDKAGVEAKGVALGGDPFRYPYEMQGALADARKMNASAPDAAARRVRPMIDDAVVELQRREAALGKPISEYEQLMDKKVFLDEPVWVAKQIRNELFRGDGSRLISSLHEGAAKKMQEVWASLHDVSAVPKGQASKLAQKAGAGTGGTEFTEAEARKMFGDAVVDDAIAKAGGRVDNGASVDMDATGSLSGGGSTQTVNTGDLLVDQPPGNALALRGDDSALSASFTDASISGKVIDNLGQAKKVEPFAFIANPASMNPRELDNLVKEVDHLAKLDVDSAGKPGPMAARFKRLSKAIRGSRDQFPDPWGQFRGKQAEIEDPDYPNGRRIIRGYSAAKHELSELQRSHRETMKAAGYREPVKTGIPGVGKPPVPMPSADMVQAVEGAIANYGAPGSAAINTKKALEELARVSEGLAGSKAAQLELDRIGALLGTRNVRPMTGSPVHAALHGGGMNAYASGAIGPYLKVKAEALLRSIDNIGAAPVPEGIVRLIRGEAGVTRGELLNPFGVAGPGGRYMPNASLRLGPTAGMRGGVGGGARGVLFSQLSKEEKFSLVALLMQRDQEKEAPNDVLPNANQVSP